MGVGKRRLILLFVVVLVTVMIRLPVANAATESLYPDGETFTLSQLSGAYTDVDDDPDSPDGLWLLAAGESVDTSVLASFGSPTGNPTVGADLQEFRVLVRQYSQTQSGTPEARIELWENGVLVRAGSLEAVPKGTGIVLSFTWNANELGTGDGSLVECYVFGKKSGGGPPARNSVEVGAIEWNVDYTSGGVDYTAYPDGDLTLTGSASPIADFVKALVEGFTLTGATSLIAAFVKALVEGFVFTGTTSIFVIIQKIIAEGFGLTGGVSLVASYSVLLAASFALAGVVSLAANYSVRLSVGVSLGGTVALAASYVKTLIEGFSLSGTVSAFKVFIVDLADGFTVGVESNIEKIAGTVLIGSMFYQLFFSLNMWGYLGPIALVVIGYLLTKKEKNLGIFVFIVESLLIAQYLALIEATPDYWWNVIILLLGGLLTIGLWISDR